jgi:hypothetical protein
MNNISTTACSAYITQKVIINSQIEKILRLKKNNYGGFNPYSYDFSPL